MKFSNRFLGLAVALMLAWGLAACGGSSSSSTPTSAPAAVSTTASTPAAAAVSGKVTVFAAASLTDAFNEIGAAFKAANPNADVSFNFAGTPTLRTQLEQGAKAEVFASADTVQMNTALQNGVVGDAGKIFVRNSLVIITPTKNTANIAAPGDLAKPGLKLVLANSSVPVGNYAHQMLMKMQADPTFGAGFSDKVLKNLVSEESDVKQVVAKVQLGEADAGVVYGTDITPSVASALKQIPVPTQFNVIAEYPITTVKGAANTAGAQAFINYVLSSAGQTILKKYGFQTAGS